jgi:hypothetical protein
MSFSPTMHPTLRAVVVSVIAVIFAGSAMFGIVVRTYSFQQVVQSSYAIWNDEQLVVFMHTANVGASGTVIERVQSAAAERLRGSPRYSGTNVGGRTTFVRVEDGVVQPETVNQVDSLGYASYGFRPRFIKGRPLVIGGFWNGSHVEQLGMKEYFELVNAKTPDETGTWHTGTLARSGVISGKIDLPVTVRGTVMTLRSTQSTSLVTVDLIRPDKTSTRLLDMPLAPKAVSKQEYESTFAPRSRLRVMPPF